MFVNERDYTVLRQLPEGKSGTSWIVTDGEKQYVLKESAGDLMSPRELVDRPGMEVQRCMELTGTNRPRT